MCCHRKSFNGHGIVRCRETGACAATTPRHDGVTATRVPMVSHEVGANGCVRPRCFQTLLARELMFSIDGLLFLVMVQRNIAIDSDCAELPMVESWYWTVWHRFATQLCNACVSECDIGVPAVIAHGPIGSLAAPGFPTVGVRPTGESSHGGMGARIAYCRDLEKAVDNAGLMRQHPKRFRNLGLLLEGGRG
jgi:hypothetical protein